MAAIDDAMDLLRRARKLEKQINDQSPLTARQLDTLDQIIVATDKGDRIDLGTVAVGLDATAATVTGLMDRLEKMGLVVRKLPGRRGGDRRHIYVEPTELGRSAHLIASNFLTTLK